MKKLLLITDTWAPQVNGVVRVLTTTKELLADRGFEVTVVHPGFFKTFSLSFYPEIRLAIFPGRKMAEIIRAEKPDYLHVATEGPLGLAARKFCVKEKRAFTTSYHTHFPLYVSFYLKVTVGLVRAAYAYMRWFHDAGSATMANTESIKEDLESRGFKNVVIWPFGVDTSLFIRSDNKELPALEKPVFAYLGRVAKEKNIEEFLECTLPGTKLVIGDGPERAQLQKKYPQAYFAGYQKGQALVDWLSLADVFVFPSRTDTFGMVLIEALALGIPVAAHDVMGPKDVVTSGVDGYLGESLEEAALKCLTLPHAKEKAMEKARTFSWDASVEAFIANLKPFKG